MILPDTIMCKFFIFTKALGIRATLRALLILCNKTRQESFRQGQGSSLGIGTVGQAKDDDQARGGRLFSHIFAFFCSLPSKAWASLASWFSTLFSQRCRQNLNYQEGWEFCERTNTGLISGPGLSWCQPFAGLDYANTQTFIKYWTAQKKFTGRDAGIRTPGLSVPNAALYQTEPHPDWIAESSTRLLKNQE